MVANALNVGNGRVVRDFFEEHVGVARRRGAHAVLASAENFYAMSILDAMARRKVVPTPSRKIHLVQRLESLLPDECETMQVVCYFRRPDRYAESLYSQHVKRGISFAGTFNEFLPIVKPALFYHRHIRVWSEVFGTTALV